MSTVYLYLLMNIYDDSTHVSQKYAPVTILYCYNWLFSFRINSGAVDEMALFAKRDIQPGEEIRWDYSGLLFTFGHEKKCLCGGDACVGYLPSKMSPDEITSDPRFYPWQRLCWHWNNIDIYDQLTIKPFPRRCKLARKWWPASMRLRRRWCSDSSLPCTYVGERPRVEPLFKLSRITRVHELR